MKGKDKDEISTSNLANETIPALISNTEKPNSIIEKQNENAKAWYEEFDTAWYFSTVNDSSKAVVKIPEKTVIIKPDSTNEIPQSERSDAEIKKIKNKQNLKTKSKESKRFRSKRFKRSRKNEFSRFHSYNRKLYEIRWERLIFQDESDYEYDNDEFQSQSGIILNKEKENNSPVVIRKRTPITIRTIPPNNHTSTYYYYKSHHLNPKKFWSWKKRISSQNIIKNRVTFDDLFISQKDYETSVRTKITQCILLFILLLQSIIFLRNGIYSFAIGILIVAWITSFYFIIRSSFDVKKQIW
ncbi:hypothetical protein C1645_733811 [Glomus cerebriforme]|uniref:Uncharacterized protein n=1 Tax=Glomus cerebriforme TaxID=658196 RepID=A0A397TFV3_9GLOM|nr:hypothetical protein C1645_733811 [Glomus cerebriforme]